MSDTLRRLAAEALGTALLSATVIGSGIMAESLSADIGIQLLANSLATGAILVVLISLLAPVSGAHFNPLVSAAMAASGELSLVETAAFVAAQLLAAFAGAVLAHAMFGLPLIEFSTHVRTGWSAWLSEGVAAFGLLLVILGARGGPDSIAILVALYIVAAYWFTASTSFANPALTIARSLTDTFAGIRPIDAPAFIVAQAAGAALAFAIAPLLFGRKGTAPR
ncbi:MAG: aquaporin family protein [Devosia sp.]|uniref:aquaporin n=1 Tax=Devosia sp. 66-22 TaxID=1895753 RepID=UPI00092CD062|nr:MIP/aquaporin family protein [Devosia sp. 66-22]MBN9345494.1 aquaporin family protein [Devosia sp.]OJX47826.1 MAG: aquaporin family protein [Devosia sp. 66-22]